MRVVVVGYGSIARRHIRNLRAIAPEAHVTVVRRPSSGSEPGEGVDTVVHDWDDLSPQLALITSPASCHLAQAQRALAAGADLMIEKPLACDLAGLDALRAAIGDRVVLVGYQFRFYRPLQVISEALQSGMIGRLLHLRAEVGMHLPDWRPEQDYRRSPSAQAALGGGALLELSHELDLMSWLGGEVSGVRAALGRLSDLEMDVEDWADVSLRFACGARGSVHLDMLQRVPFRGLKAIGSEGTLTWAWDTHRVRCWTADRGDWVSLFDDELDRNAMYAEEMRHLLACVASRGRPAVGVDEGETALRLVLAAKASAASEAWVTP